MTKARDEIKIFCCYSRKDNLFLENFKTHITALKIKYSIDIWYDRHISPGTQWHSEIMQHLDEAHIILLFISPDLISSEYAFNTEVQRAVERHKRGEAKVIPIILRPATWDLPVGGIKLDQLQALPNGAIPIIESQNPDGSWKEVTDGIECVVKELLGSDTGPLNNPGNLGLVLDPPSVRVVSNGASSSRLSIKPKGSLKKHAKFLACIIIALSMLLVLVSLSPFREAIFPHSSLCPSGNERSSLSQSGDATYLSNPFVNRPGIKETMKDVCGNVIGLSAGATVLDIEGEGKYEMQQGATALRNDNPAGALAHFQTVTTLHPSNAEAWIYTENLQVLNRNLDYIAVVLGLDMTSKNIGSSRESMRGAYLAQKAHNEFALQRNSPSLVLLLANSGAVYANATWVAKQIIELNRSSSHIVGVVGWSGSVNSENANQELGRQPEKQDNVFMLAPSASSSSLINYPYFLRIIPSDIEQGGYLANHAYDKLHYRDIAIIYNSSEGNSAGINMRTSFEAAFTSKGGMIVRREPYDPRNESSLGTALNNALQSHPDGIGFFGLPADAGPLLSLPQIANLPSTFKMLVGSALASVSDFPANQPNLDRLVVSAFASEDEWQFLHVEQLSLVAAFIKDYKNTFKVDTIGTRAILNYDAVNVFLEGYRMARANGDADSCLPCALKDALQSMNGDQAWQGVSGQIAFKSESTEPVDKVILIVEIEENKAAGTRATKTVDCRGCFLKDRSDCKR